MCTFGIGLKGAGLGPDEARAGWQQTAFPRALTVMETDQRTAWAADPPQEHQCQGNKAHHCSLQLPGEVEREVLSSSSWYSVKGSVGVVPGCLREGSDRS